MSLGAAGYCAPFMVTLLVTFKWSNLTHYKYSWPAQRSYLDRQISCFSWCVFKSTFFKESTQYFAYGHINTKCWMSLETAIIRFKMVAWGPFWWLSWWCYCSFFFPNHFNFLHSSCLWPKIFNSLKKHRNAVGNDCPAPILVASHGRILPHWGSCLIILCMFYCVAFLYSRNYRQWCLIWTNVYNNKNVPVIWINEVL